jgi:signal transduction histidine kinase
MLSEDPQKTKYGAAAAPGCLEEDDAQAQHRAMREKLALFKQRNKAICEAARGVAHDFNNLLMTIQGSLELIHADPSHLQRDPTLLQAARDAVERSRDLSRLLVDMASHRERQVVSLDPGFRLSHLKPLLRAILGPKVRLDFNLEGDLWPVRAHPGQFDNAMINLAVNARHAMPVGGILEVAAENTTVRTYRSDVHGELEPGKYVHIIIRDSGVGIEPAIRDRMFQPDVTTRAPGEGSGLGLAMVSQFVDIAGGHVTVESAPGEGAEFHIYLPQDDKAEETSSSKKLSLKLVSNSEKPSLSVVGDA